MHETIFTLCKRNEYSFYRGAIVSNESGKKRFVEWIKPTIWLDNLPEFLREEFTKKDKTMMKYVEGHPETWRLKQK